MSWYVWDGDKHRNMEGVQGKEGRTQLSAAARRHGENPDSGLSRWALAYGCCLVITRCISLARKFCWIWSYLYPYKWKHLVCYWSKSFSSTQVSHRVYVLNPKRFLGIFSAFLSLRIREIRKWGKMKRKLKSFFMAPSRVSSVTTCTHPPILPHWLSIIYRCYTGCLILGGQVQNENTGLLLQKLLRISRW